MKKLFSIFLALAFLIGGNAYAENITIKCVDKKRDAQLILNFDEGGDWLMFNGREKDVAGKKETVFGEERITVEITKDKIKYMSMIYSAKTHMVILINRFDGTMYQYGKIDGGERYDYNYICEKSDRKF
tara:strand:- start:46 stop:432 length:387 start_codon:yes stop_codon:yes gene_type:complete